MRGSYSGSWSNGHDSHGHHTKLGKYCLVKDDRTAVTSQGTWNAKSRGYKAKQAKSDTMRMREDAKAARSDAIKEIAVEVPPQGNMHPEPMLAANERQA